jgi:hypothetical protein
MATDDPNTSRVHFASAGAIRRTFSTPANLTPVQVAHTNLIGALSFSGPNRIFYGQADHHDVRTRADHLKTVLGAVATYVNLLVEETVDTMPLGTGCIDRNDIAASLSDLSGSIIGQFSNAVDAMIEAKERAA